MRAITGERSRLENSSGRNVMLPKVIDPSEGTGGENFRGSAGLDPRVIMTGDVTDFTEVTTGCWIFISAEDEQLVRGKGFGNKR